MSQGVHSRSSVRAALKPDTTQLQQQLSRQPTGSEQQSNRDVSMPGERAALAAMTFAFFEMAWCYFFQTHAQPNAAAAAMRAVKAQRTVVGYKWAGQTAVGGIFGEFSMYVYVLCVSFSLRRLHKKQRVAHTCTTYSGRLVDDVFFKRVKGLVPVVPSMCLCRSRHAVGDERESKSVSCCSKVPEESQT